MGELGLGTLAGSDLNLFIAGVVCVRPLVSSSRLSLAVQIRLVPTMIGIGVTSCCAIKKDNYDKLSHGMPWG